MNHTHSSSSQRGFTLVELSIVLVILGLLVGGVLSGQSLIRASELRTVSSEFQRFTTAVGTFSDKYFALPGDMSNATAFGTSWIGNGDGDGQIENNATNTSNEISLFWVHLSNAGLVEGSFANIGGTTMTGGTNNPRAKLNNAAWNIAFLGTMAADGTSSPVAGATVPAASTFFANSYGNVFLLGGGTNALLPTGVLKAEEAWNLDTKLDDALPHTGTVTALESQGNTTCHNVSTSTSAISTVAYLLTNSAAGACSLVFKSGY